MLGLCKQFLGFFREGLQQAVVTDLTHDELLEVAPVGLFAVQVEAVLTSFVLGRLNFGASHNLIDGLNTAFDLQKPDIMYHLGSKIIVVVVDDGGGKIAILHR